MTTSMSARLPPRRATIRDVASLAGVGTKTVSRVINDEPGVSEPMRHRVERAIRALNFKPNQGAGALRRGSRSTQTIGLLVDSVENPFSAAVNRAVEIVASSRGMAVFAASFDDDPVRERDLVEAFLRRRVDGLILTTITADHGYLQHERDQGTPIVFVDRPPVGLSADAVLTDNYEASGRATRHLLDQGHRRIAHLGDELGISTARERRRGFDDAMSVVGLDPKTAKHTDDLRSDQEAYQAVRALMDLGTPPTALFTSQNMVTIGAVRALHHLGLQHRVALVGFDDVLLSDVLDPPISVIAQDAALIGQIAAERIFARLDGDTSAPSTRVVPTRLLTRGSGEIRPDPVA